MHALFRGFIKFRNQQEAGEKRLSNGRQALLKPVCVKPFESLKPILLLDHNERLHLAERAYHEIR